MLDDELQLVRQGWLWKGGRTFGQYTQKRRHFLLVRNKSRLDPSPIAYLSLLQSLPEGLKLAAEMIL